MRDPEAMLSFLKEMAAHDDGWIVAPAHMGMSVDEQRCHHHVELLADAGHAQWNKSRSG